MALKMRPTYYRHLSLAEQKQIRFGTSPNTKLIETKDAEGKIVMVRKLDKTKSTLKKRLEEKKKQKEIEKKEIEKKHDTKSVRKTSVSKDAFSKSASKTKQSLKKSAKATSFKGKKEELDDMFVVDKETELLKEPKTKKQEIEELKKFSESIKKDYNRGLKNYVASGLYDPRDKRKSGYFMRNASLLFDTFG